MLWVLKEISRRRGKPLGVTHPSLFAGQRSWLPANGEAAGAGGKESQVSLCDAHFKDALYFVSIVRMRQTPPPQGVCFY
jgi:hypothetical protein